jgi:hypothetical protein
LASRHGDENPYLAADEVVQDVQGRVVIAVYQRFEEQQLALESDGVTGPGTELARTQPSRAALPAPDAIHDFVHARAHHPPPARADLDRRA